MGKIFLKKQIQGYLETAFLLDFCRISTKWMTPLYFLLNDEDKYSKYDLQTYLVEHDAPID